MKKLCQEMRFISSLTWIKRGVSKTPTRIKLEQDEMRQIFSETPANDGDDEDNEEGKEEPEDDAENEQTSENEEVKINRKYKLDNYDEEEYDLKMDRLTSLACFPTNAEDDILTRKDDGEDSDVEDLEIKSTDNLIVCGTIEDDDSCLNIYVYNEIESNFYIHHDILLSAMPICIEWLDFDPSNPEVTANFIAVGTLNPWIEIWDLDLMDSLEPEFLLGTNLDDAKSSKKKKKGTLGKKQKVNGHKDAVLDLAYNLIDKNVLASASADKTIVLWDLEELKQAVKIKNHTSNVQTIKFHPLESFSLLAGSADETVCMYDCRNPKENKKSWNVGQEVEQVLWNKFEPNQFLCSDNQGNLYLYDMRQDNTSLATIRAHESSASGIALSHKVPGLLATASEEESVKIWDIQNSTFELVHEKKLKLGPINCAKSCPDGDFVFAFGGIKSTEPLVWDIRDLKEVRTQFYPRMGMKEDEDEIKEQEEREKRQAKRRGRAQKFKEMQQNSGFRPEKNKAASSNFDSKK